MNTLYIFEDNEFMDCAENIIAYGFIDDMKNPLLWLKSRVDNIGKKFFIQFWYENGSFIRAHSGKVGFLKYIRLWKYESAEECQGYIDINVTFGNMMGLGNKSIQLEEFVKILLSEDMKKGNFSTAFKFHGDSQHPDFPKEPNIISRSRKEMNENAQAELIKNMPEFNLANEDLMPSHVGISFHGFENNLNEPVLVHTITAKDELLDFLQDSLSERKLNNRLGFPSISVRYKSNQSESKELDFLYLDVNSNNESDVESLTAEINYKNYIIRGRKENVSLHQLVLLIFDITTYDKQKFTCDFTMTCVEEVEYDFDNKRHLGSITKLG